MLVESSRSNAAKRRIHAATSHPSFARKRLIRCSTLLPFCFGILAAILALLVCVAFNLDEEGSIRIRRVSAADMMDSKIRLVVELPEEKKEANGSHDHVAGGEELLKSDNNGRVASLRGQQSLEERDDVPEQQNIKNRQHRWTPTKYTTDSHVVAGVNLATYGVFGDDSRERLASNAEPFELFEDFDIGQKLAGDETWWDIQTYKRHQGRDHPSLTFYVDKIAQKRWLPTIGYDVPKSFELRYKTEIKVRQRAVKNIIPKDSSFVAKSSHFSEAKGVIIVECCKGNRHQKVGRMLIRSFDRGNVKEDTFDTATTDYRALVAKELAENMGRSDQTSEDAQLRLTPGVVIEERFFTPDDASENDLPAIEFKCFVIWGRFWIAHYRRGPRDRGYWNRKGEMVYKKSEGPTTSLPDFVDWSRIVRMAEDRAKHMDLLRVDIYVGKGSASLRRPKTRYVMSEVEMEQTSKFDPALHEEGARLIIAGYKIGNYRRIKNNEIPKVYFDNGLRLPSNYTEICQKQSNENELCWGRY